MWMSATLQWQHSTGASVIMVSVWNWIVNVWTNCHCSVATILLVTFATTIFLLVVRFSTRSHVSIGCSFRVEHQNALWEKCKMPKKRKQKYRWRTCKNKYLICDKWPKKGISLFWSFCQKQIFDFDKSPKKKKFPFFGHLVKNKYLFLSKLPKKRNSLFWSSCKNKYLFLTKWRKKGISFFGHSVTNK